MEILFVSHKFPPSIGGMEKQSYELIHGMEGKCKVHRLVYQGKRNKIFFLMSLRRKIRKLCERYPGINVIHFNDGLIAASYIFFPLNKRIAYGATLHGLDVVFPSYVYHHFIFKRFNRYDFFIAVSHATARKAIELGIERRKIVVVENGVDVFECPNEKKESFDAWLKAHHLENIKGKRLLMLMGRPVFRKGLSWFVEKVMPKLNEYYFLFIVGPFRKSPGWKERIYYLLPKGLREKIMLFMGYVSDERELRKALKGNQDVCHLGSLSREEINFLLRQMDVFLMPNLSVEGDMEGFGLVCLEASVNGAIVFASDVDGIPDAIKDGQNGFLLPAGKEECWEMKLKDFAVHCEQYESLRGSFEKYSKSHYSWELMVERYYRIFEKVEKDKFSLGGGLPEEI